MSEKKESPTAIERLELRLRSLKGRVVMVYMQIDTEGKPVIIAVQNIGKVERLLIDKGNDP
ncbi:MAG: hypothetical protein DWQ07_15405 [Chloroflexi bacterium]|nr:MAG: hypothetical protein DWQ07_15405 [Chloroflexota bacterium]